MCTGNAFATEEVKLSGVPFGMRTVFGRHFGEAQLNLGAEGAIR